MNTTIPATAGLMIEKFTPQLLKSDDKATLVVVVNDRNKGQYFSNLESQPGVKIVPFDKLRPHKNISANTHLLKDLSRCTSTGTLQGEYTKAEKDAVIKIQRLWISCVSKIRRRRLYVSLPENRAITFYFNMAAPCSASTELREQKAIRKLLVLRAVSLYLRLGAAQESLTRLQKDGMACVENVEISIGVFESIDDILTRNREVESLLREAREEMSEDRLVGLVREGVPHVLAKTLSDAERIIVGAEERMSETRVIVDGVVR